MSLCLGCGLEMPSNLENVIYAVIINFVIYVLNTGLVYSRVDIVKSLFVVVLNLNVVKMNGVSRALKKNFIMIK